MCVCSNNFYTRRAFIVYVLIFGLHRMGLQKTKSIRILRTTRPNPVHFKTAVDIFVFYEDFQSVMVVTHINPRRELRRAKGLTQNEKTRYVLWACCLINNPMTLRHIICTSPQHKTGIMATRCVNDLFFTLR